MDALLNDSTTPPPVVGRDKWLAARKTFLEREKELTRFADEIARERRAQPWLRIDKDYRFDTPQGPRGLADLFEGRRQLVLQHLMFAPGWGEACKSCSYMADHTDPTLTHLAARDTAFVAVSRAPLSEIEPFKRRMGWRFPWVSSFGSDFNRDFHVTFTAEEIADGSARYNWNGPPAGQEMPAISVFVRDEAGAVLLATSIQGRGVEAMMHAYRLLDLTPKGRDEEGLAFTMAWVRHHDRYEAVADASAGCCGR
jgi:predicted dithiol-disulfide oxidoreductase (DUF899 family)